MKADGKNILFICEGSDEEKLFNKLFELYPIDANYVLYQYQTNLHLFGKFLFEEYIDKGSDIDDLDIIQVLKDYRFESILDMKYTDILLVFDFDPQDPRYSPDRLKQLQYLFSESTNQGQLYINYPMIEASLDFDEIPDFDYIDKTVDKELLKRSGYKNKVRRTSAIGVYSGLNSINLPIVLKQTDEKFLAITDVEDDSKYDKLLDYQIQLLHQNDIISIINTSLMFLKDYNTGLFNNYTYFSQK